MIITIDGKSKFMHWDVIKDFLYHASHGRTFAKWAVCKNLDERKKEISKDKTLIWNIAAETGEIADHIEISGQFLSAIISYGKDKNGKLRLLRHVSFPSLRVKPNLTYSHFRKNFDCPIRMYLEDTSVNNEQPQSVKIRGNLVIESSFMNGAKVVRTFAPSPSYPALIEKIEVTNLSRDNAVFTAAEKKHNGKTVRSARLYETLEVCSRLVDSNGDFRSDNIVNVEKRLVPSATASFYVVHYAIPKGTVLNFNAEREIKERCKIIDSAFKSMQAFSGDNLTDALFSHCMLRGTESIFSTKNGLLHSPGGGNYYAAAWANDQCEYANPFFPYTGNATAVQQAINCYKLFTAYILKGTPIPQSIVAEGEKSFITAGDRGDTEMFASGLSRFLLALGNKDTALEFLPALEKALEYILSKKSDKGVIYSDSDELEGRFPTGGYNLSTNCLAYDSLVQFSILIKALGKDNSAYIKEAEELKTSILSYFRGEVEGFDTYKYYDNNTVLRSWICMPSVFGISEAAESTYNALFDNKMYGNNTLRTASSSETVWDRALLFALRGAFASDYGNALNMLYKYSESRLLGSHSPYPYEAYPEGNRAHLAGESVLYLRIFTEGILGMQPLSFTEMRFTPRAKIRVSGINFSETVFEADASDGLKIKIGSKVYQAAEGQSVFDFEALKWK